MVNDNTSEEEIFNIFKDIPFYLEDAHSDLYTQSDLGDIRFYQEEVNNNPINYLDWDIIRNKYMESSVQLNNTISFAQIKDQNIGYIRVASFHKTKFSMMW